MRVFPPPFLWEGTWEAFGMYTSQGVLYTQCSIRQKEKGGAISFSFGGGGGGPYGLPIVGQRFLDLHISISHKNEML